MIVKEGRGHQEVYAETKDESPLGVDELAEEMAKIPSRHKREKYKALGIIFICLLVIAGLLRLLAGWLAINLILVGAVPPIWMLLLLVVGLFIPFMGIFGVSTGRHEWIRGVPILYILLIIKSVTKGGMLSNFNDPLTFVLFLPFVACIVLGFVIPNLWKTKYRLIYTDKEKNGRMVRSTSVEFERDSDHSEVIDSF